MIEPGEKRQLLARCQRHADWLAARHQSAKAALAKEIDDAEPGYDDGAVDRARYVVSVAKRDCEDYSRAVLGLARHDSSKGAHDAYRAVASGRIPSPSTNGRPKGYGVGIRNDLARSIRLWAADPHDFYLFLASVSVSHHWAAAHPGEPLPGVDLAEWLKDALKDGADARIERDTSGARKWRLAADALLQRLDNERSLNMLVSQSPRKASRFRLPKVAMSISARTAV